VPNLAWLGAAAVYVELLGKGGLWGVGADYRFDEHWRAGAVVSATRLDDETLTSVTPYVAGSFLVRGHHSWYLDAGPHVAHLSMPSPVPEWHGMSSTGVGLDVSTGYEFRDKLVVRVFGMATIGDGGVAPWLGASFGWTL
jgi:hypothetical protein